METKGGRGGVGREGGIVRRWGDGKENNEEEREELGNILGEKTTTPHTRRRRL